MMRHYFEYFLFISDSDFNPFDVSHDTSSMCSEIDSKGIYTTCTNMLKSE